MNAAGKAEATVVQWAGKAEVPDEECDGKVEVQIQHIDDGGIATTTPNTATNCDFLDFQMMKCRTPEITCVGDG